MVKIINSDLPFERIELSKAAALDFYKKNGEKYKAELVEGLEDEPFPFINRVISPTFAGDPITEYRTDKGF